MFLGCFGFSSFSSCIAAACREMLQRRSQWEPWLYPARMADHPAIELDLSCDPSQLATQKFWCRMAMRGEEGRRSRPKARWRMKKEYTERAHVYTPVRFALCLSCFIFMCVWFCFVTLYLGEAKLYVRSCMFAVPVEDRNREGKDKTGRDASARKSGIHGKSTCVHTCSVRALLCLALPRCVVFCWPCTWASRSCMFKVVCSQIRSKIGMEECWPKVDD